MRRVTLMTSGLPAHLVCLPAMTGARLVERRIGSMAFSWGVCADDAACEKAGVIMPADATRLTKICDKAEVTFFCPIVLRLDIDQIDGARRKTAGSGASVGSHEYLIPDLRENEFDILFLDVIQDPAVQQLVVDEIVGTSGGTAPADAMDLLETRMLP